MRQLISLFRRSSLRMALLWGVVSPGTVFLGLPPEAGATIVPLSSIQVLKKEAAARATAVSPAEFSESDWEPVRAHLPVQNTPHWLRIRHRPHFKGDAALALFNVYNFDEVRFFRKLPSGTFAEFETGLQEGRRSPRILGRHHGFPLLADPAQQEEVYVRISGIFSFSPVFRFEPLTEFFEYEAKAMNFVGFHGAVILLGAVLILVLGALLRGIQVNAYLIFSLGMSVASLSLSGTWGIFFGPSSLWLQRLLASVGPLIPVFGSILFVQSFLSTRETVPRIHLGLQSALYLSLIALAFRLGFPWNPLVEVLSTGVLSAMILSLTLAAAVIAWRKRLPQSGHLLTSRALFTLGVLIYIGARRGTLPPHSALYFAPMIAQIGEVIILTDALIQKFSGLFQAKVEGERARLMLRVLSHDLGNSVTTTKFNLEQMGELSEENIPAGEMSPLISSATEAIRSVETLLRDLREFLSLQSNKANVTLHPIPLSQIRERLSADFERRLTAKKVSLEYVGEWTDEARVMAELESLCRSVLGNALSNAIKFSQEGATIHLRAERKDQKTLLSIEDHGVGMPPEILANVLDPDAQTTRKGTAGEPGTGFGMPILAAYVKQYGGKVRIESKVGEGTAVRVLLKNSPPVAA
jgi:signal transduction histidine kinase